MVLDLLTYAGNRPNLDDVEDRISFVQGDIADFELVEQVPERTDRRHRELRRRVAQQPGRDRPRAVLPHQRRRHADAARGACSVGIDRFHHISTCEVYGDLALDSEELFTEKSSYQPRTPYNASKAGADHAVRAYHETYGLPVTITNCANNYGPYQFPEKVIPVRDQRPRRHALADVRADREPARMDPRPRPLRRHRRRAATGRVGETYHVGTGVEKSIEEIADAVLAELGKPAELKTIIPDRPGHDRRYILDWTKIRRELGWEPRIPFDRGLAETVHWYAQNRDWWEPLRERAPVVEGAAWK